MIADPKEQALKALQSASRMLTCDLNALPEEAFNKSFGPKTRTVADIIFEINLVNDHIAMVIRGEEPFPWPEGGWIKAPDTFAGKATVTEAFEASISKIIETVESFSLEQLTETIKTENAETSRYERCRFMAMHMVYHSGQLNFIQTLLGDDEWHW